MMKNWKEILCDAFRPKGDIFMSSWYDRKAKEWEKNFEHMTKDFEEQVQKFNKKMRGVLKLDTGREWKAMCEEEAYDPDILLDCGGCGDHDMRVHVEDDGYMVFEPKRKETQEMAQERARRDQLVEDMYKAVFAAEMPEHVRRDVKHLRRMASDIDAEIACLEGLDDWRADELARQDKIQKRAIEKIIRNWTER